MEFKRARSEQQVKTRIAEIVGAAAGLYDQAGYEGVTFTAIAAQTQFTRPAIYKYFTTKEEILLRLLAQDIKIWTDDLYASFKDDFVRDRDTIADLWVGSLTGRKRLLELYCILFTALEHNCSVTALADFKVSALTSLQTVYLLTAKLFPNASDEQLDDFLNMQLSLILGLFPMCSLTPVQQDAIALSKTGYLPPDFESTCRKALLQFMHFLAQ